MYDFLNILGKFMVYLAVILLGHDLLNYLEFDRYEPTTSLKLYQLVFDGYTTASYTSGSSFFDQLLSWPGFIVFGCIGFTLRMIFKGSGNAFNFFS